MPILLVGQLDTIPSVPRIPTSQDTLASFLEKLDSTGFAVDTLVRDSIPLAPLNYRTSGDGFNTDVDYGGDSTWFEARHNKYHLYGRAFVNYESMSLQAGYIVFDIDNDIAEAFAIRDKEGRYVQQPVFKMDDKQFSYRELKFNFKTKKGIVTNARTQEGEFQVLGEKTKFISKESDSLLVDDEIYNTNALITTCDHEQPHYGIRTKKLKLVPNKIAVVGFSQLEIAGIPLPIFLPFGFFPLVKGQSSGLILPQDYEFDQNFGLGFREIGYYFPINDYVDLRLTGDIYTRGTWRVRAASNYKKRYSFSGRFNIGFANNKIEDAQTGLINSNKSFSISLSHSQDPKAHPYRNIGGTINIQTNNYQRRNFNDANSQLNNRLNSNFYFRHSLPGTPFSLSAGMSHDQNNQTRQVNVTLPDIRLNMNTIFPFKRKNASGKERWYEKFSLKYDMSMKNVIKATDTTLFTNQTLEDMQTGVSHSANTTAAFNVLKYFNLSPSASYEEFWFFSTTQRDFDPTISVENIDTIIDPEGNVFITADTTYGQQIERIERGFQPVRLFQTGLSMSTQIFGTKTFSKGLIRGIRHIIKPTISFNYSPDSRSRYFEQVDTDTREEFNDPEEYNPYRGGPVGSPSLSGQQMALNFSINNVIEGKYYSKKDSTEKKFKIFPTLNFSGGYNFAADSLNWQDLSFRGNTRIMGLVSLNFSGRYSPYVHVGTRRTAKTLWSDRRKLLEFRELRANFSTNIRFTQIRDLFRGKDKGNSKQMAAATRGQGGQLERPKESILDLLSGFSIGHRLNVNIIKNADGEKELTVAAHSLTIRGNIPLTNNWKMNIGNISYDLKNNKFVYPSLGLTRDLHCWNMNFNWYPQRGVYAFFVGVKSNALSFVKYNYGQGNAQSFFN